MAKRLNLVGKRTTNEHTHTYVNLIFFLCFFCNNFGENVSKFGSNFVHIDLKYSAGNISRFIFQYDFVSIFSTTLNEAN